MELLKRIGEKTVDYAVPVVCAAAMVWLDQLPPRLHHWMPVLMAAVLSLCAVLLATSTRREVVKLRQLHRDSDAHSALMVEATRAQLDDSMGKLYAACMGRGYTTEDERRCYDRMEKAYEAIGGNGEAKRRSIKFFEIAWEEQAMQRTK